MRTKYLLAVVFFIAACNKELPALTPDSQGAWELVSSDGAWSGHREFQPGNGNILSLNGNKYAQTIKTTDTTYHYSGTYIIYTGKPCDIAIEQTLIKFNDDENPSNFSLKDGKLIISSTECITDGGSSTYKKIQ